jgi:hypothetical protein
MVAGEVVFRDGRSTKIDENELKAKIYQIAEKMI